MIEFLFNKIVFNYRHVTVPIAFILLYKVLSLIGDYVIKSEDMPLTDARYSSNPIVLGLAIAAISSVFIILAIFTHIRYYLLRNRAEMESQTFLNNQIK